MNPRAFGGHTHQEKPLTTSQITKRLWELGVTQDMVYDHILSHKHLVPIEAWICLWKFHLNNPTLHDLGIFFQET